MRLLRLGDVSLEYAWAGDLRAAGPTLVFLHDGLGSVSTWGDLPAAIAESTGLRALAYSRVGYGGSTPVTAPRTPSFMHEEAVRLGALLAALRVGEAVLVGHSDGGSIALIHAASGAAVRGLVLEAPHVFVEEVCVASIANLRERYRAGELTAFLQSAHGANAAGAFERWAEVWLSPEFRSWSIADRLPAVACPVLVVHGDEDPYGTLAQVEAIRRGVSGPVEALVLEGCGHTPHRTRRAETLAAVGRFLHAL